METMECTDEQKDVRYQTRMTAYWKSGMQTSRTISSTTKDGLTKLIEKELKDGEQSGDYELLMFGDIVKVTECKEVMENTANTRYFVDKTTNPQLPRELRK